jgi:hypothetical protein
MDMTDDMTSRFEGIIDIADGTTEDIINPFGGRTSDTKIARKLIYAAESLSGALKSLRSTERVCPGAGAGSVREGGIGTRLSLP